MGRTEVTLKFESPQNCSRILLHSCCAPCSGAILECMVRDALRPAIFFSNSNIVPLEEYGLRKQEITRYAAQMGLTVIDDDYNHEEWLQHVKGLENEPERGSRCMECFKFRLRRAAQYAAANGYDCLATTLASSRWKSLEQVNTAGGWACEGLPVTFWAGNWRKGGLQPRRNEIIREQNFYNQNFCGCEFSKAAAEGDSCRTTAKNTEEI